MQDVRFAEYFPAILVVFAASIVAGVLLTVAAVFTGGLFAYALADSLAGIWFAAAVLAGAVVLYLIFRWLDDRERQAEHEREISRMQAEALLREREPQPVVTVAPVQVAPELPVETVNQMNADYRTALHIAEATLRELGKVADGERLLQKPFSFDNCQKAKLVSRWEQWHEILALLEASGVGTNLTSKSDWQFNVNTIHQVENLLRDYYIHKLQLVRVNGNWMRK